MVDAKVLIGVATAEFGRRADFYDYLLMLEKPEGHAISMAHGQSPARGRNMIIDKAIEGQFTHILFLDDDMVFPPNLISQLLKHDKEIVSALYLWRSFPHRPIIFKQFEGSEGVHYYHLNGDDKGLVEIVAAGFGACLIKTEVFAAMERPWVRLGEIDKDHWCDDIGFFLRVKEAGFKAYCDTDCPVGHIGTMIVTPFKNEQGEWMVNYNSGPSGTVSFPAPKGEANGNY